LWRGAAAAEATSRLRETGRQGTSGQHLEAQPKKLGRLHGMLVMLLKLVAHKLMRWEALQKKDTVTVENAPVLG
jgi:hypothetical protein